MQYQVESLVALRSVTKTVQRKLTFVDVHLQDEYMSHGKKHVLKRQRVAGPKRLWTTGEAQKSLAWALFTCSGRQVWVLRPPCAQQDGQQHPWPLSADRQQPPPQWQSQTSPGRLGPELAGCGWVSVLVAFAFLDFLCPAHLSGNELQNMTFQL